MHPLVILLSGMAVVIAGILWLRLHAFLALILGAFLVAFLTPPGALEGHAARAGATPAAARAAGAVPPGQRVVEGFGRTAGQLAVMVGMASIIGTAMLHTGAAERIVRSLLAFTGQARASLSFLASGFILAIPVFFDTVFYLLVPLAKAMGLRTGRDYLLYVLAIVTGATMTHSLVPPTPGPLFVANAFGVSVGHMILVGLGVSAIAATLGYTWAHIANERWPVPLRESPEAAARLEAIAAQDVRHLPPLYLSLAPILLPVVLITLNTGYLAGRDASGLWRAARWLSEQNIVLVLAAALSLAMLWRRQAASFPSAVDEAITSAGNIILITAAGGAFGAVLQQSGIGPWMEGAVTAYSLPILPLAWALTMMMRTALGSATVAMITAAGALAPLAASGSLGFHPVWLAVAIGSGSKPIWWMNDSGFWVISKMGGLTEQESLRVLTPMSVINGTGGLVATIVGAWLFPMS
ncbi:MAG TPA: SLC13 family permease [Vicinamibacterales bacterium]|nr:SLC13 family permease [Vicinamibacterales bacterium]